MTLSQLKSLLIKYSDRCFRVRLPDGSPLPASFHVTEVGRVDKVFLDCGGTLRTSVACQLQVWVGQDFDHRIETGKMASILEKAKGYLADENIPVEIEYEDRVISQYTIDGHEITDEAIVLNLAHTHTECLAPELCGLPPLPLANERTEPCCGPGACC